MYIFFLLKNPQKNYRPYKDNNLFPSLPLLNLKYDETGCCFTCHRNLILIVA